MLAGDATESDRTDFPAVLTKCGKVGTHSKWEHMVIYKQNMTKFIRNCTNTCISSQRTHLCRCRDSFGKSLVQFHYLLFFSSRCFKARKKKTTILSTAEIKKPHRLRFLGVFISSRLVIGQSERLH